MSMNNKQRMDLDTVSRIDDDIIEKNTEKRIKLLKSKSRITRNRAIALIAAAVLLITALASVLIVLFAKQVPVYEGMTAHSSNGGSSIEVYGDGISFLSAGRSDQNGFEWLKDGNGVKHDGNGKDGRETESESETESETSSLDIPIQEVVFYTRKNTDFYIKVHISNPDSFEILSFTLNGKKYSSYMFEDGSDMENLILKCNVGDAEGIVEYTIDAIKYVDGTAIKDVVMEGDRTIKIGVYTSKQPTASVSDIETGLDSIDLDVTLSDQLELIRMSGGSAWIELMQNGTSVEHRSLSLTEKNSISFESLEIGAEYEYKIVARFDALDGKGTIDREISSGTVSTKNVFDIVTSEITQESVSFGIEWSKIAENKTLKSLALYRGEEKIADLETDVTELNGLFSGIEYVLVGTYEFNGQTVTVERRFTTVAKAEPTFTFRGVTSDTYTVNGEYDQTNVDNTLISYTVSLYKGDELVKENADKKITFDSLDYYTDYTIRITYTFDVNDGKGVQEKAVEYAIRTLPYIDVTECNIANTSAVSEGDTIFMQVKLDNPLNMTVESVVVNGETYGVTGASTANKIFVEIVYDDQFAGGDTYLKIDKVNAKIDETSLTVAPKTELSDNVFINGKLDVLKIEYVNEAFEPVDWAFPSEKVYLLVTLSNPTGYIVDEINLLYDINSDEYEWITIDNNHLYCVTSLQTAFWSQTVLTDLSYHNEYVEKALSVSNIHARCYGVASDTVIYVSTPDDLKNMEDGYYYELKNNIDLSGREWRGSGFNGVLEGKGYSIKNMSFVGTVKNSDVNIGLFSSGTGLIQNLNIEKATIIVDLISDNDNTYTVNCGSLVAFASDVNIKNCSTDADSIISVTNGTHDGRACAGGLAGENKYDCLSVISNSVNRANVSANAIFSSAGGIAAGYETGIIRECANYGAISAESGAGGSSGAGGISGGGGSIYNCINYGSVSASGNVGGIAGWGGNEYISNCLNVGEITGESNLTAGIAGSRWNSKISCCINVGRVYADGYTVSSICGEDIMSVDKCYGKVQYNNSDPKCTVDQLNSKEFYTETLGWSEDVWDFSNLDVENGKYPMLK